MRRTCSLGGANSAAEEALPAAFIERKSFVVSSVLTRIRNGAPAAAVVLATPERCCPACTEPIRDGDDSVRLHGERYHSRCTLYKARGRTSRTG